MISRTGDGILATPGTTEYACGQYEPRGGSDHGGADANEEGIADGRRVGRGRAAR